VGRRNLDIAQRILLDPHARPSVRILRHPIDS
jgi:hypothetical protein